MKSQLSNPSFEKMVPWLAWEEEAPEQEEAQVDKGTTGRGVLVEEGRPKTQAHHKVVQCMGLASLAAQGTGLGADPLRDSRGREAKI